MKFLCKYCGLIFKRDMRKKIEKMYMLKKGYVSYCTKVNKAVYCKPITK